MITVEDICLARVVSTCIEAEAATFICALFNYINCRPAAAKSLHNILLPKFKSWNIVRLVIEVSGRARDSAH